MLKIHIFHLIDSLYLFFIIHQTKDLLHVRSRNTLQNPYANIKIIPFVCSETDISK